MLGSIPAPILSQQYWADLDASTFRIRGKSYNEDRIKVTATPAVFKLIAIDIFTLSQPVTNIADHPRNRVHQALERGDKTWVFVVNYMIPGPVPMSFVVYLEGDKTKIDEDTPFGRVAQPFFNGLDDEYRNSRFKLIPKIVEGNMIVKMAVKDTPALTGRKLKQHYFKGVNYFEVDIDIGSSSIARNLLGLSIGYSKLLIVDMAFVLQGNEEDELPEVLMGGCSCIHVDFGKAQRL